MNRLDLSAAVAARCGLRNSEVDQVLETALKIIVERVAAGESVKLQPYFHIQLRETKETRRRNPKTGATFVAPAGKRLKIVPGKRLSDAVPG